MQMAKAQDFVPIESDSFAGIRIASISQINNKTPLISIARNLEAKDFQGVVVEDVLNFNLGVNFAPFQGLN